MSSIDKVQDQLYSRQMYAVGKETQAKYSAMDVLVVGGSGPSAEIVKNLILTGVHSLTIADDTPVTEADQGTNFFIRSSDIGKPRSQVIADAAKEMNRFVTVTAAAEADISRQLAASHVVVFVNQHTGSLIEANALARASHVKFIACESRGVCGRVFVDAGEAHTVVDANGEDTVSCVVTSITTDGIVTVHDDKTHECEVGSRVYFTGLVHPAAANSHAASGGASAAAPQLFEVTNIISPCVLQVKGLVELGGGKPVDVGTSTYMHTTKQPVQMSFLPLEKSLAAPEFCTIFDSETKFTANATLHAVFSAIDALGHAPRSEEETAQVLAAAKANCSDLEDDLAAAALTYFHGDLNPMACLIGGITAQETLKVCSGKYTPIHQWLYYDCRELLYACGASATNAAAAAVAADAGRHAGQSLVLGADFQQYLSQQSAFIVGAGALGCELIKNAALMGLGSVSITDMDNIEMSNLSRQFLFRERHVGQPKSIVAAAAAREINPAIRITAYEQKVGPETEGVFNETFWAAHSVVENALDNVASRKYVDERCLFYKKPLIESGTLGSKCNMQPVIPFVTESYSSTYDPPEKSIPLCTLKNFPSAIEHTIQWARDQFHLLFSSTPSDVNTYLQDPKTFAKALQDDPAAAGVVLRNVNNALRQWPQSDADCVTMARKLYHEYFNESFRQLLHNIPLDKVNEDGSLFWTGAKKPPTPQEFDPRSAKDVDFVYHTACLLAKVYHLPPLRLSPEEATALAASIPTPAFVPKHVVFSTSEKDKTDPSVAHQLGDLDLADLPPASEFAGRAMVPQEFEKDDATNHHVEFITFCSNLRAEAYKIPPADLTRTKQIAGKIIPAMVTTTSLVTGLVGLEMLKYMLLQFRHQDAARKHPAGLYVPTPEEVTEQLLIYRTAFVNVALPFFAFSDPIIATGRNYTLPSGKPLRWTIWDRIDVNEGRDISVNELVSVLEARYEMEVFMITLSSGKMVFMQFGGKKADKAKLVSVVAQEKGELLMDGSDFLNLVATGMIGEEDDVDVPVIRYKFRNF